MVRISKMDNQLFLLRLTIFNSSHFQKFSLKETFIFILLCFFTLFVFTVILIITLSILLHVASV